MSFVHSYNILPSILCLMMNERRLVQQLSNFLVRGLCEILVPCSNATQILRSLAADDFIHFAFKLLARLCCAHWHRNNDAFGISLSECLYRGTHACSGGQPVIDQN